MPVWIDLRFLLLLVWLFSAIHQYLYIGPARVCQAPVQREMRAPSSNAASGGGCLRSGIRSFLVALPRSLGGLTRLLDPGRLLRNPWLWRIPDPHGRLVCPFVPLSRNPQLPTVQQKLDTLGVGRREGVGCTVALSEYLVNRLSLGIKQPVSPVGPGGGSHRP